MEKVLILGNKGMLGHVLFNFFKKNKSFNVIGINRSKENDNISSFYLDVLNFDALEMFIKNNRPKYIINCVGLLVKASVDKPSSAIKTNSLLPHFLNEKSGQLNFKLIHISTDCVFDGKKGSYQELDFKTETNYYGLTKNLGEVINDKNLTIRTSIIGPELKLKSTGLFEWIMSQKGNEIQGYTKVIWSGLSTIELSKFIIWAIKKDLNGLVHATNGIGISKYDLVKIINEVFRLDIKIIKSFEIQSDKSLINNIITDYEFPNYTEMIEKMKIWINDNSN